MTDGSPSTREGKNKWLAKCQKCAAFQQARLLNYWPFIPIQLVWFGVNKQELTHNTWGCRICSWLLCLPWFVSQLWAWAIGPSRMYRAEPLAPESQFKARWPVQWGNNNKDVNDAQSRTEWALLCQYSLWQTTTRAASAGSATALQQVACVALYWAYCSNSDPVVDTSRFPRPIWSLWRWV